MNVLFVCAQDYPDMDEVRQRLMKGSKTEHVTYRRKGDRTVKALADELGLEIPAWVNEYDYNDSGEGYALEALNWFDVVIVYTTEKSSVTKFYVKKATDWPYDRIFGHKVDITTAKSKVTRKRKAATRRQE